MTPDQIAEMTPSQLAPIVGALLSGLERVKLTPEQKAALEAALLDANNRPVVVGDAGDLTAEQLASLLGGGGLAVASLSVGDLGLTLNAGNGPTTLTLDVGGTVAVLSFDEFGVNISRTGALAVTVGLGGGVGADPVKVAEAILYSVGLLIDAGDFGGAVPFMRFKGPGRTLPVDHFNPGAPGAEYALLGARGVIFESKGPISLVVGGGVADGLTVDP